MLRGSRNLLTSCGTAQSFARAFRTTSRLNEIFTVQDEEDFKKRVLESDKPVVLDFYAK